MGAWRSALARGRLQKAETDLARAMTLATAKPPTSKPTTGYDAGSIWRSSSVCHSNDEEQVTSELASPLDTILGRSYVASPSPKPSTSWATPPARRRGSEPTRWAKTTSTHKSQSWLLWVLDLQPVRAWRF